MAVNNDLHLGVGNVSHSKELNKYYQDVSPSLYHYQNSSLGGGVDEFGLPYLNQRGEHYYSIVNIIQYGLICHELVKDNIDIEKNTALFLRCTEWLDNHKEDFKDTVVWRTKLKNLQYKIPPNWISGMYQGQAISLFLRAYQLTNNTHYLEVAEKAFELFKYDYNEGGVKRIDKHGCIWFEEYPTATPSYVLNGYVYCMFGIYDLYRVTGRKDAKDLFDSCVHTLEVNLHEYHRWYWSVYDQYKRELVSYYYQKNVHVPLMQIMFLLTNKEIFNKFAIKWEKSLNSKLCNFIVKIMYRIKPRLNKMRNLWKKSLSPS